MQSESSSLRAAVQRKASFLQTLRAVLWSFLGIRKGKDHDADMASLNPLHVILAGVLAAILLIAMLLAIVRQVVAS
ncbi:DUF2970 domain-containing protein [Parvibium lacunae]|uniref:DUF2970 domain-containing protein n=1 Tax=Parvibium lacunae TaxID=1888893 RepID=A0A368L011_9BURK|nr:DUF2970 domain-containing protein [Parvibium lacunae]RCS56888.1 DUF2970 domain-containing protein [Parvibium lacunae]